jgi:hypothetical protein
MNLEKVELTNPELGRGVILRSFFDFYYELAVKDRELPHDLSNFMRTTAKGEPISRLRTSGVGRILQLLAAESGRSIVDS